MEYRGRLGKYPNAFFVVVISCDIKKAGIDNPILIKKMEKLHFFALI